MKFIFPLLVLTLVLFFENSFCQHEEHAEFHENIEFIDYLISNYEYENALSTIEETFSSLNEADSVYRDSLFYYKAWIFYNQKSLDSSAVYFGKVPVGAAFYYKSRFYQAIDNIYMFRYNEATSVLQGIVPKNEPWFSQLKALEEGGTALLLRKFDKYEEIKNEYSYSIFSISEEQKNLNNYFEKLKAAKRKSLLASGLLSTIIPGTGKIYSGYKAQGVATLLYVGIFAAVAAEAYFRAGPASARFIITGSLFSVFYAGNIWGSVISAKHKNEDNLRRIDDGIMLNMHLPLRRIFN